MPKHPPSTRPQSHAAESPSSNLRVETTACVALGVSQGHACPAYWMMRICTSSPVMAHHGRELAPPHDEPSLHACMEVDSQKSTRKRSLGGDWITGMRLCASNYAEARTTTLGRKGPMSSTGPRQAETTLSDSSAEPSPALPAARLSWPHTHLSPSCLDDSLPRSYFNV